jgi:hypothetical protein
MCAVNVIVCAVVGVCALCCACWVYSLVELLLIWLGWKEIDK